MFKKLSLSFAVVLLLAACQNSITNDTMNTTPTPDDDMQRMDYDASPEATMDDSEDDLWDAPVTNDEESDDLSDNDEENMAADDDEDTMDEAEDDMSDDEDGFSQTGEPQPGDTIATVTTNLGSFKIRLFGDLVPKTVENFVTLANNDYYDGIIFHRVISGFMIQGGDPTGTGTGGESAWGGKFDDEFSSELSNIQYSISMANAGPNTNGSQFFINQVDNTFLDFDKAPLSSKHSVFGQVYEGQEVIDNIAAVETGPGDKPVEDVVIEDIEIMTI